MHWTLKRYYLSRKILTRKHTSHFFFSFLEFCVLGKTDDSHYCRTSHTHKSCQICLKGNPQLMSTWMCHYFQMFLQKECFIMTDNPGNNRSELYSAPKENKHNYLYLTDLFSFPQIKNYYLTPYFCTFYIFACSPAFSPCLPLKINSYFNLNFVSCQ